MANKNRKKSNRDRKSPGSTAPESALPANSNAANSDSANSDPVYDGVERTDRFSARKWLTITISVAVVWWIALSLLTLLSANPTTVNRKQIVDSDVVVVAEVESMKSGLVTVTKQWIDPQPQSRLTVSGLSEFDVKNGDTIVLPLTGGVDGTFYLTRVHRTPANPNGTTYIYPATDIVFEQVDEFATIRH